jgi:hypothetical protein
MKPAENVHAKENVKLLEIRCSTKVPSGGMQDKNIYDCYITV